MEVERRQDNAPGDQKVLQTGAVLVVGATAVAFVAGLGTYLSIRFTQHHRKLPGEEDSPRRRSL